MAEEYVKIKRSQLATFLNTTPGGASETWVRFGKGVTSQSIAYNPTINTEQYIDEDNATSSVDSYAPTINTPLVCYKGEPVFEYVNGLRRNRAIGNDAITDILIVEIYDKTGDNYVAEKQHCAIAVTDFGGESGNPVSLTFDINYIGDPIKGNCTITNGTPTFTASK